jgi:16S rRNA (cytidine1402-2'-O)-methyltransferase
MNQYGKLVIIGSHIGNIYDFPHRGLKFFEKTNLVLCEDTRETSKTLSDFGIQAKLISYVGSFDSAITHAKKAIFEGYNVALMCDRGMPCISDPGAKIIALFRSMNVDITCIPGPSSVTVAFALTGYSGPFIFHGFLPRKKGDILKIANKIGDLGYNIIFFESAIRLLETLKVLSSVFVDREVTIARELTKVYEEIIQDKIENIINKNQIFKGECVLIIKGY